MISSLISIGKLKKIHVNSWRIWIMVKVDNEKCDQCGTCVSVCPTSALMFIQEPVIDQKTCIGCGKCIKVCPFSALSSLK